MSAYIKAISYYLPPKIVSNQDLVKEFPEWSVDKIAKKVGVLKRHVVDENQCASDLAVQAANKMFLESGIEKNDVDFVLLCTQSPDYFLPTTACVVQDRLGLKTQCGALDFNLGCSGFVYGLAMAKGLVESRIASNVLLLTSETYTKHIHERDKGNKTIFGDAATATIISSQGYAEIRDFDLGTDGSGCNNLIVKTGAMRNPVPLGDLVFDKSGNPVSSDFLYMNGSEIFNFTLETVPELVDNVLQKNGMCKDDIDLYVFHQANNFINGVIAKMMKLDKSRIPSNIHKYGNTSSVSIPLTIVSELSVTLATICFTVTSTL